MRNLNKQATKTFLKIVEGLAAVGDHKKIDNSGGTFMAVSVELIGVVPNNGTGNLFSITHYYEQNGDLMRDPEMIFWEGKDDEGGSSFFPVYFRQDGFAGREEESVVFEGAKFKGYRPRVQKDHAVFANMWMKNIKYQQSL